MKCSVARCAVRNGTKTLLVGIAVLLVAIGNSSARQDADEFERLFQQMSASNKEDWTSYYHPLMKLVAAGQNAVEWIKKEAMKADGERAVDLVYLLSYFGTRAAEAALEEISLKAKNILPRISALSNIKSFAPAPWNPTLAKIIAGPLIKETASACDAWTGHRWYEGVRLTCALLANDDGDWKDAALEVRLLLADNLLRSDRVVEGLKNKPPTEEAQLVLDALRAVLSNARKRLAQSGQSMYGKHLRDFISSVEASLKKHGGSVDQCWPEEQGASKK